MPKQNPPVAFIIVELKNKKNPIVLLIYNGKCYSITYNNKQTQTPNNDEIPITFLPPKNPKGALLKLCDKNNESQNLQIYDSLTTTSSSMPDLIPVTPEEPRKSPTKTTITKVVRFAELS